MENKTSKFVNNFFTNEEKLILRSMIKLVREETSIDGVKKYTMEQATVLVLRDAFNAKFQEQKLIYDKVFENFV